MIPRRPRPTRPKAFRAPFGEPALRFRTVRALGQGPYSFGGLVAPGAAYAGLGNAPYPAIGWDVYLGVYMPSHRIRQPYAVANPTYRVQWVTDRQLSQIRADNGYPRGSA